MNQRMSRTPVRGVADLVGELQDPDQIQEALRVLARNLERAAIDRRGNERVNIIAARKLTKNAQELLEGIR